MSWPTIFGFMASCGNVSNMALNSFMYNNVYSEITNMKVFLNFTLSHKNRPGIVETQNRISYVKLSSELLVSIVLIQALLQSTLALNSHHPPVSTYQLLERQECAGMSRLRLLL